MNPRIIKIIDTSKELMRWLGVNAESALQAAVQIEQIRMWEDVFVVVDNHPSAIEKIAMAMDGTNMSDPGIRQFIGEIANSMRNED